MELSKLKVIAEGMGYEIYSTVSLTRKSIKIYIDESYEIEYCPDTTNNMVEIMDKALEINELVEFEKFTDKYYMVTDATTYGGKTLAEAVCKWAYEHYKAVK